MSYEAVTSCKSAGPQRRVMSSGKSNGQSAEHTPWFETSLPCRLWCTNDSST